ncbi:MAG: ferrous iron transport protein A [Candidatus Aminicenantes bacterium]|jgi:Fe2+ transport system protein FeoA|nr:ferrous iron transport protein A [Candidatus Aminicenantes bacterium]
MQKINLNDAPANNELEVLDIDAGRFARQRLIAMGIHPGDKLLKFNDASWGPVLIQNVTLNSSKIAIGRRLAQKILVRYENT